MQYLAYLEVDSKSDDFLYAACEELICIFYQESFLKNKTIIAKGEKCSIFYLIS